MSDQDTHRIYEAWHRPASLKRFLTPGLANELAVIDIDNPPIDNIFWCRLCKRPVAIAEDTTVPLSFKQTEVTFNVVYRECRDCGSINCDIPGYVIRFWPSDTPNPTAPDYPDIDKFEVQELIGVGVSDVQTPQRHANFLFMLHGRHLSAGVCPELNPKYLERLEIEMYEKVGAWLRSVGP